MSLNKFMILEKSDKEFDINGKVLFTMEINFQNGNQLQRVRKKKVLYDVQAKDNFISI